ncbi:MAG: hypothetical protein MHM6MM_002540 [Cercozoa sp. M6MM]
MLEELFSVGDDKDYKSEGVRIFSIVAGWTFFLSWSMSFYPQVLLNWRRKSVVGYSLDYLTYNITGFVAYSIYCVVTMIQQKRYDEISQSVKPNDTAFAVHAVAVNLFVAFQCMIYERGTQKVSPACRNSVILILVIAGYNVLLAGLGIMKWAVTPASSPGELNVVEYFGYVKTYITFIKYVPQAILNVRKKNTIGWSIHMIWFDGFGGVLALSQQFLDAWNYDDWTEISTNIPKLLISFQTVFFDSLFLIQHYLLYANNNRRILEEEKQRAMYEDTDLLQQTAADAEQAEDGDEETALLAGPASDDYQEFTDREDPESTVQ